MYLMREGVDMRFLIIEDNDYKASQFIKYLSKDDKFTIKGSYNSGLRELFFNKDIEYDCIILDMNFPMFDNDIPCADIGLSILKELKRKKH